MNRIFLAVLLLCATSAARAEWIEYAEIAVMVRYYDPATIKKQGDLARVWEILDYKVREKDGTMSARSLLEFDCKEERVRTLSITTHSEPMARGKVLLSSDSMRAWTYLAPETVGLDLKKIVCR